MFNLFITSQCAKAGKTMLAAGLIRTWLKAGKKVGYQKFPSSASENPALDKDTVFLQTLLDPDNAPRTLKDVVISEGQLGDLASELVRRPGSPVLVIHDYNDPWPAALVEYQKIGAPLIAVIINKVPLRNFDSAGRKFSSELGLAHIACLGLIPEDRILMALSVSDLVEAVQGKIVNNPEHASDLIENLMIGSSTFDRGPAYYNRKSNKAVLLWGDRPGYRKAAIAGLQQSALMTSTRCVVVGHNAAPLPAAVQKADEQKATLVSAPGALPEMVTAIEKAFQNLTFSQSAKLPRLDEILTAHLDIPRLNSLLGL